MSRPPLNRTAAPYRFEAFEVSYFSAKVRPALRYKGLWVDERRANLGDIYRRTGFGFIPILITPEDETWQDSTDIYRRLEDRHPDPPLFPQGPRQRMAAHLIEIYCDEIALIPAMHYRWGSEMGEATARARFAAMTGSRDQGNLAADQMVKARYMVGASEAAGPVIEEHTRELLALLSAHFESHPYLLGARQSFADCALMGPVDGHFFCDLVSRKLLLESAYRVVGWIERCKFPNTDTQGEWLDDDALAPTLVDILRMIGRDSVPLLLELLQTIEEWADSKPRGLEEIPRGVGKCKTRFRGQPIERLAMPYTLFNLQPIFDLYRGLGAASRDKVQEMLAGTDWPELLAYEPRHRLRREGFKLVFDENWKGN